MILLLAALFVIVPLAELYLILKVGDLIGVAPTLGLLVLSSLVGSGMLRSQGRAVWRQFNEALGSGRMPHRELFDGVAVIFGGAFLITPGFITDIVGLLLLVPPTRRLARRFAARRLGRRFGVAVAAAGGPVEGVARTPRDRPARRDLPPEGRIDP